MYWMNLIKWHLENEASMEVMDESGKNVISANTRGLVYSHLLKRIFLDCKNLAAQISQRKRATYALFY